MRFFSFLYATSRRIDVDPAEPIRLAEA